jgi:hypothetical protein
MEAQTWIDSGKGEATLRHGMDFVVIVICGNNVHSVPVSELDSTVAHTKSEYCVASDGDAGHD